MVTEDVILSTVRTPLLTPLVPSKVITLELAVNTISFKLKLYAILPLFLEFVVVNPIPEVVVSFEASCKNDPVAFSNTNKSVVLKEGGVVIELLELFLI